MALQVKQENLLRKLHIQIILKRLHQICLDKTLQLVGQILYGQAILPILKPKKAGCMQQVLLIYLMQDILSIHTSKTMHAENTVIPALKEAYFRRKPKKPLVFHSDKGSQYTSKEFRTLLNSYGFIQSMSSNGCYDNAPSESFFKTLKAECIYMQGGVKDWKTTSNNIFDYVYCFYNTKRLHSSLGYKSPMQYMMEWEEAGEEKQK